MKLEIRLDSDETYSVVDTHFNPSMLPDPSGVFPKNKALISGLTKEDAQTVLKIADQHRLMGFRQGLEDVEAFIDSEQRNVR